MHGSNLVRRGATQWFRSLAVVFTLTLGFPGSVSAQCVPFPRQGMKEIPWGPASFLQIGMAGPLEPGLNLTLMGHPTVGAAFASSSHRHRRTDGRLQIHDFAHAVPGIPAEGLWAAVLRAVGDPTPHPVGPAQAGGFHVFVNHPGDPRDVILSWSDLQVPGIQAAHRFWFEMRIRQPVTDRFRFEFESRMARLANLGTGTALTLDEVLAPIVRTLQPGIDPLKCRTLVPVAQFAPLPAQNLPLTVWSALGGGIGLEVDLEHPARGQQMQFSALYGGDPVAFDLGTHVISPFEKILYFSTEDPLGYYKRFVHRGDFALGLHSYRWAPKYFPEYGPAPALNCFQSRYPAVMKGLTAKSNAWWFDVCAEYREFVRREMGLTPMRDAAFPLNAAVAGGESVVVATINLQNNPAGKAAVFADYVDHAINLEEVFKSPGTGTPAKVLMEWQKWYNGALGSGEDLIGPGRNPKPFSGPTNEPEEFALEAIQEIRRAAQNDINVVLYTLPLVQNAAHWPTFHDDWFLRDRLGAKDVGPSGAFVDFGNTAVPNWYANTFFADILDAEPALGGLYLDFFGGAASFLRYLAVKSRNFFEDPTAFYLKAKGSLFKQKYHGGAAFVRGGVRTMDLLRDRILRGQQSRRSSERPFIPTEAVMEHFAGHYDIAQHGLKPIPGHTQMSAALEQLAGLTGNPMPLNAAANNPPLWNGVYHEFSRADALGMMLNTAVVSAGIGGGGFGVVDWATWARYNRMIHALMFIGGMKSSVFSYFQDFQPLSLVQGGPSGPGVQNPAVPEQVELLQFMQRMHEAGARLGEAGALVTYGAMERPLDLPQIFLLPGLPIQRQLFFFPGTVDSTFSPSPTIASPALNFVPLLGVTLHYNEDFTTSVFPYQLPKVLQSVWRAAPGAKRIGLVLVNWTDEPAFWQGTFRPGAYDGFTAGFKVTGVRPDGAGVIEYPVGQGTGNTVMGFSTAALPINLLHHGQGVPGLMPPRSVQVFFIEPQ